MTCFRLVVVCLFGLAAITARAQEQPDPAQPLRSPTSLLSNSAVKTEAPGAEQRPDPPRPLKKPSALLSSRVVKAKSPAALSQPGTAEAHRDVFIQLASLPSSEAASRRWQGLRKSHPHLLSDFHLTVEQADLGDRGLYYRVQVGPLPNQATAKDLCWQLKAKEQDCIVVQR